MASSAETLSIPIGPIHPPASTEAEMAVLHVLISADRPLKLSEVTTQTWRNYAVPRKEAVLALMALSRADFVHYDDETDSYQYPSPHWRPPAHRMSGASDGPWVTLAYGELPSRRMFREQFERIVGRGKKYTMELTGTDAEIMRKLYGKTARVATRGGKMIYKFDEGGLYHLVEELAGATPPNVGQEAAREFANNILRTLRIEWSRAAFLHRTW